MPRPTCCQEEAAAAGAKAKVKSGKSKAKDAEMKELEAQLRALQMAEAAKKATKKPAGGGSKKVGRADEGVVQGLAWRVPGAVAVHLLG